MGQNFVILFDNYGANPYITISNIATHFENLEEDDEDGAAAADRARA